VVARGALKVGLITDGGLATNYVADLVDWISKQSEVELTAEIVQRVWFLEDGQILKKALFSLRRRGVLRFFRLLVFRLISFIDQVLTKKISPRDSEFLTNHVEIKAKNRLEVRPKFSSSGFVFEYPDDDLKRIKELDCDVLIRCGSGILKGGILEITEFGVLSLHHGDNTKFRGGPPGFWEVLFKESQTGFIVQKLTDILDGGVVVAKGSVGTKPLFTWNCSYVIQQSSFAICKVLSQIAKNRELPSPLNQAELGPIYRLPSTLNSLRYFKSTSLLLFRKVLERVFNSNPTWRVFIFDSNWREIDKTRGVEIPNPKGCFSADPFLISSEKGEFLFVEEFSFALKKAHIAVYDVSTSIPKRMGIAINEKFHVSFPYVFQYENNFYMCPETIASRQVRLYKAVDFPLHWELQSVLLDNVCAADPLIFMNNGKFWLLTNLDPKCSGDSHSMLSIFYSDYLQSESWMPSELNPVLFDASCARNGGFFCTNDMKVRFGQVQGFNLYGESLRAFEIVEITESKYREEEICLPKPDIGSPFVGMHHLSSAGGKTAVDIFK
jgi:hypothetical protein